MSEHLIEKTEDVRRVVGVKPGDGRVAAEPGLLLAGVDAGVALDAGHSLVERKLAVEVLKKLLVTDRVEGVEVALGIEGAGLAEEAVGHHLVDAGVDATEEFFARADKPDLEDAEGAHFDGTRAEVGIGAAGGAAAKFAGYTLIERESYSECTRHFCCAFVKEEVARLIAPSRTLRAFRGSRR